MKEILAGLCLLLKIYFGCIFQVESSFSLFSAGVFKISGPIEHIIDSLKCSIYKDTSRFDSRDIVQSSFGKLNKNGYSPLFVIDKRYKYKLDIVSGDSVLQFVNEFLRADRIMMINVLSPEDGYSIYGMLGAYGVVVIETKRPKNVHYKVAGLLGQ